jgi:rod shape-determining protein MreD
MSPLGISPNFILVLLIFIGLTRGSFAGQLMGFAWGITWDILAIDLFGSHAFLFTCIGYLSGFLSHKWNESKVSSQVILGGVTSVFLWIGMDVLYQIFSPGEFSFKVNYIVLLQPVYNMIITPLVFKIIGTMVDYVDIDHEEY